MAFALGNVVIDTHNVAAPGAAHTQEIGTDPFVQTLNCVFGPYRLTSADDVADCLHPVFFDVRENFAGGLADCQLDSQRLLHRRVVFEIADVDCFTLLAENDLERAYAFVN